MPLGRFLGIILAEEIRGSHAQSCVCATWVCKGEALSFPRRIRRWTWIGIGTLGSVFRDRSDFHSLFEVLMVLFDVRFHLAIQTVTVDGDAAPAVGIWA